MIIDMSVSCQICCCLFSLLIFLLLLQRSLNVNYHIADYCSLKCEGTTSVVCERKIFYCKQNRLMCGYYVKNGLTDAEVDEVLDAHNKLRNKAASGEEKRGKLSQASDMNALSYSKELEFSAQCTCNKCEESYDNCKMTPKYAPFGQNILSTRKINMSVTSMVEIWYEEITKYDLGENYSSKNYYGRFTQLLWASTTVVGCGKIIFKRREKLLCCNYAIAGNKEHQKLYRPGPPCSSCQNKATCNTKYKSLCGEVNKSIDSDFTNPFRRGVKIPTVSTTNSATHIINQLFVLSIILFYNVIFI